MKKIIGIFSIMIIVLCLSGCDDYEYTSDESTNNDIVEENHTGKCLEYTTKYKLDCGLFTCSDSLCCERKYDVCVKWETINE